MNNWNDPEAARESERYENPIPSRHLLLEVISQSGDALSQDDLIAHFNLTDSDAIEAIYRRLTAMVRAAQLIQTDDRPARYRAPQNSDFMSGRVQAHANGFGFVVVDGGPDLYLNDKEMRLVFNGDTVQARALETDRRGRLTGAISKVIKRQQTEFIGRVVMDNGDYYIRPPAPNQHQPIDILASDVKKHDLNLNEMAKVKIEHWPTRDEYASGKVIESLAQKADTQLIIPATLLDYDIPHEFSEDVIKESERFKEPGARDIQGRTDLRALPLVTIDGEDARDFDDAVYAEKRAGGGYRLVVAIADVSHYVRLNTALDTEAYTRGTSVYFPNFVVPMLPEVLSNGLCSLKPHVDRLCMVCDITLSRVGRVTGYTFYAAVMHSQARLTYTQVAAYLDGQTDAIPAVPAVQKSINTLNQLYKTLLERRSERGAMEFETTETYMTFDELGGITEILPRTRNEAHRLIEECMLLANVCAADFAITHELPVLYRNHEKPEPNKVQRVRDYVRLIGLDFPENPTQADYQKIIEATRDRIDAPSIHSVLLRSMMQAYYGVDNLGHYGLAYDAYSHFTSPIRRYPDLMLHRAIKAYLKGEKQAVDEEWVSAAGVQSSQTERRAEEASRKVTSWLKVQYMQQHLGEEFEGVITSVLEFGLFVTLTRLFVEGLVHVRNMGNDFFVFDAASQTMMGQRTGQRFAMGDKVRVKVAGVNLDERQIDFELMSQLSTKGSAIKPVLAERKQSAKSPHQAASNQTVSKKIQSVAKSPETKAEVQPQPEIQTSAPKTSTRPTRNQRRAKAKATAYANAQLTLPEDVATSTDSIVVPAVTSQRPKAPRTRFANKPPVQSSNQENVPAENASKAVQPRATTRAKAAAKTQPIAASETVAAPVQVLLSTDKVATKKVKANTVINPAMTQDITEQSSGDISAVVKPAKTRKSKASEAQPEATQVPGVTGKTIEVKDKDSKPAKTKSKAPKDKSTKDKDKDKDKEKSKKSKAKRKSNAKKVIDLIR